MKKEVHDAIDEAVKVETVTSYTDDGMIDFGRRKPSQTVKMSEDEITRQIRNKLA